MGQEKKGKKIHRKGMLYLISIIIGISGAEILLNYSDRVYPGRIDYQLISLYVALCLFFAMNYIHVIIHEAGHLIFGLATGYSFLSFRIGNTTFVKEDGKLKRKKFGFPGTSGQCLLAPPEQVNGEFPYQLYNYGGVIMNFLTALLCIFIIFLLQGGMYFLTIFLGTFAACGIFVGIMNGFPMYIGVANDGLNVRNMSKDATARQTFYLQLDLYAKQCQGMRMKDMPMEWFQLPEDADFSNSLITYIRFQEYYRYLDRLELNEAQKSLTRLEGQYDQLPIFNKNIYNLEQLFLCLINKDRRSMADQYLTKEVKKLLKVGKYDINFRRVDYFYHLIYTKDAVMAEKILRQTESLASHYPVSSEADSNMMLIDYARNMVLNE